MKKGTNWIRLCNIALVVLMLAMLVCQFLPFWAVGEEQFSMQEYTWFTWNCAELTDYLGDTVDPDFMVKDVVLVPFVMLFGCVLGSIFCLLKRKNAGIATIPLCVGAIGVWGYLTNPAFQLGALWQVHLVLCILMVVVALIPMSVCVSRAINWFKVPKEA